MKLKHRPPRADEARVVEQLTVSVAAAAFMERRRRDQILCDQPLFTDAAGDRAVAHHEAHALQLAHVTKR